MEDTTRGILDGGINNDVIVCEILSRLPVKSLMRFKCVSKGWLNLIEEDSYFTYLHLSRSKARPSLVYVIPLPSVMDRQYSGNRYKGHDDVFLTADLSLDKGIGRADIHTMMKTNMFSCDYILRPLNGLMCFVDCLKYAVCIYNISTREKDNVEVPPFFLDDFLPNVYVNGSIYWCSRMFTNPQIGHGYPSCMAAFDVGSEKFRVIEIPDFIRDQPLDLDIFSHHFVCLVEFDGHVGILRRISAFISKLCIFNDHHHHGSEKVNKTKGGEYWIEETITLPFPWTKTTSLNIYDVVGTHRIVLQTYEGAYRHMNNVSLYSYHWKEKTFTEIGTSGAPLSVPDACTMKMFSTFVESLVPVQRKRINKTTLHN
ncbi:hypothetical protein MKW98_015171 [Papaver atlanticum]|uniref:F-box domain-containing protein n=1 Tax=Papaver atlanticum TaxID=357466 RepID=A0AAD4XSE7_9MAGN|nr:hypothetical protein MKW98_015171 [Papaver atlanticum]